VTQIVLSEMNSTFFFHYFCISWSIYANCLYFKDSHRYFKSDNLSVNFLLNLGISVCKKSTMNSRICKGSV